MLFGIFFKLYNFLLWVLYVQLYYLMLWHNIRNLSNNSMYLVYLTSSCVNWARFTRVLNWPTHAKKAQFTHEQVEYNIFLFDEPLKGSKSLKIF
jgi:hypothetical protein